MLSLGISQSQPEQVLLSWQGSKCLGIRNTENRTDPGAEVRFETKSLMGEMGGEGWAVGKEDFFFYCSFVFSRMKDWLGERGEVSVKK